MAGTVGVGMRASPACLKLICDCEGLSYTPYLCPAGKATIGYGSTVYPDGSAVTMDDAPITTDQAISMLEQTLTGYEDAVNKLVHPAVTQGQFDALVDFAYNCGIGNLASSTLLKLVNQENFEHAAQEFGKWVHGGGRVLPGLVKRRALEQAMFEGTLA